MEYNKLAKAIAVALPLAFLAGCSSDSNDDESTSVAPPPPPPATEGSVIVFDAAKGSIPYPNDINGFDADGTLAAFGETQWAESIEAGDSNESPNAYWNYHGSQDGWGSSTPMIITLEEGVAVDPETLTGDAIRLFRETDEGNALERLVNGEDFRAIISERGTLNIEPLHPYDGGVRYVLALTTGIKDINGDTLGASSSYLELLSATDGSKHSQHLQSVIHELESAGVDATTVVYGADFTVASTLDIVRPVVSKFLNEYADNTAITNLVPVPAGRTPVKADALVTSAIENVLKENNLQTTPLANDDTKNYDLYTAEINLPSYLDTPVLGENCEYYPSLVDEDGNPAPGVTVPENMDEFRIAPEQYCAGALSFWQDSNGKPLTGETASDIKAFAEPDNNKINVAISLPNSDEFKAPYKTFMYAHGYGSSKDEIGTIAHYLADKGYAMIAIDQPMHGDRTVDINNDGTADIDAAVRRTDYVVADNLLTTRAFLTQGLVDYVGLRYAIANGVEDTRPGSEGEYLFDTNEVHMAGLSLGGITTTSVSSLLKDTQNQHADVAEKLDLKTTSMFVPGGGVASIILQSPALAGEIETDLLDTGMFRLEMARLLGLYSAAEDTTKDAKVAILGTFDEKYRTLTDEQLADITAIEDDEIQANAEALEAAFEVLVGTDSKLVLTFNEFEHQAWLNFRPTAQVDAQSVVDAGDPITWSTVYSKAENQDEPLFLMEAVGDGSNVMDEAAMMKGALGIKPWNPGDFIIVNQAHEMPLSGSDPLIRTMGLEILSCDIDDSPNCEYNGSEGYTVRGAARYGFGTHMSSAMPFDLSMINDYLLPNDVSVHNSVIKATLSFADSYGESISVPNEGAIKEDRKVSETLLLDAEAFPKAPDYTQTIR